jgi:hypothetical protein
MLDGKPVSDDIPMMTMASNPEIHLGLTDTLEPELPLSAEGVLRYVWHSRYGDILIEVRDRKTFVNGRRVDEATAPSELP